MNPRRRLSGSAKKNLFLSRFAKTRFCSDWRRNFSMKARRKQFLRKSTKTVKLVSMDPRRLNLVIFSNPNCNVHFGWTCLLKQNTCLHNLARTGAISVSLFVLHAVFGIWFLVSTFTYLQIYLRHSWSSAIFGNMNNNSFVSGDSIAATPSKFLLVPFD